MCFLPGSCEASCSAQCHSSSMTEHRAPAAGPLQTAWRKAPESRQASQPGAVQQCSRAPVQARCSGAASLTAVRPQPAAPGGEHSPERHWHSHACSAPIQDAFVMAYQGRSIANMILQPYKYMSCKLYQPSPPLRCLSFPTTTQLTGQKLRSAAGFNHTSACRPD